MSHVAACPANLLAIRPKCPETVFAHFVDCSNKVKWNSMNTHLNAMIWVCFSLGIQWLPDRIWIYHRLVVRLADIDLHFSGQDIDSRTHWAGNDHIDDHCTCTFCENESKRTKISIADWNKQKQIVTIGWPAKKTRKKRIERLSLAHAHDCSCIIPANVCNSIACLLIFSHYCAQPRFYAKFSLSNNIVLQYMQNVHTTANRQLGTAQERKNGRRKWQNTCINLPIVWIAWVWPLVVKITLTTIPSGITRWILAFTEIWQCEHDKCTPYPFVFVVDVTLYRRCWLSFSFLSNTFTLEHLLFSLVIHCNSVIMMIHCQRHYIFVWM